MVCEMSSSSLLQFQLSLGWPYCGIDCLDPDGVLARSDLYLALHFRLLECLDVDEHFILSLGKVLHEVLEHLLLRLVQGEEFLLAQNS